MSAVLSASLEDYLEAIFHIAARRRVARPRDISRRLGVSQASVTGALRSLADKDMVNYAPYDVITLTPRGDTVAKDIVRRHEALSDFFVKVLAVEGKEADECACRMEHALSPAILDRLVRFVEFVQVCPRAGAKWIEEFIRHCGQGRGRHSCERCVSLCLQQIQSKTAKGGSAKMAVFLGDLGPGQKARVTRIEGRGPANKRIADMGVTPGTLVEVERVAPLGDPIDVKVRGYHLSLRKDEAAQIRVVVQ